MSAKATSIIWEADLKPSKKFVLLALADGCGTNGEHAYPSIREIAGKTSLNRRTIKRILLALKDDHLIAVSQSASHDSPNRYRLDMKRIATLDIHTTRISGVVNSICYKSAGCLNSRIFANSSSYFLDSAGCSSRLYW